ncbi:MAG: deoxyribonuclease IV [Armatimonadota bacterium]
MRIGMHVSGGLRGATSRAAEIGCEAVQVFASNPSAWRSPPIPPEVAAEFSTGAREYDLRPVVVHTPYLLNLSSPDDEVYAKSVTALADGVLRAKALGADFVVTHIGSHKGSGFDPERVRAAVWGLPGTMLLLENSAGGGNSVGADFAELAAILEGLEEVGVCIDTAHAWGAGYDVSTPEGVEATLSEFDSLVGLSRLKLLHLNDTGVERGSRRDRHANIGTGRIGEGIAALVNHPALTDLAGIIETPPRQEGRDIDILKGFRL